MQQTHDVYLSSVHQSQPRYIVDKSLPKYQIVYHHEKHRAQMQDKRWHMVSWSRCSIDVHDYSLLNVELRKVQRNPLEFREAAFVSSHRQKTVAEWDEWLGVKVKYYIIPR